MREARDILKSKGVTAAHDVLMNKLNGRCIWCAQQRDGSPKACVNRQCNPAPDAPMAPAIFAELNA